jgi:hypothetical protein
MKITEIITEAPLPGDWDPQQFHEPSTSFKSRLAYALERAKRLGTGSSRVAMTIDYEGRPTVLKVAKNQKGLAQNSVEADILRDGYASQLGIMIPLIDFDTQNKEPVWIHTEMAQKANDKQLCAIMRCESLMWLITFATAIAGKSRFLKAQDCIDTMADEGKSQEDIDICTEYANKLADLTSSFDIELGDFTNPRNWGLYQGQPVVIDVGLTLNVFKQYYR